MKTHAHRKNIRRLLSLLLCCLLVTGCFGLTVSAGEDEPDSPPETSGEAADENAGEAADEDPGETAGEITGETPEDPELPADEDDPDPEPPENATVTVTFDFGVLGVTEQQVIESGQAPESSPVIPDEYSWQCYELRGWRDKAGEVVEPTEIQITEDTTYTAWMERQLDRLLCTDEHKPFVSGKSDEIFDPMGYLTRAQAAAIISSLLRDKSFDYSVKFKDVPYDPQNIWYVEPIGRISALNIAGGYSDGKFKPNASISRAEFIVMASACDEIVAAECPFLDVSETPWAKNQIASAYAKGWVSGKGEDKFCPNDKITRAEAVTIVNRMLGRQPDENIRKKEGTHIFCDVFPTHWSYNDILEAATEHDFFTDEYGTEHWRDHTYYAPTSKRGWLNQNGTRYYIGSDGKCLRGLQTLNGTKYRFNDLTGAVATGFFIEGSWERYYKNGALVEDISNLGVVKGPYYIKVYKPANYLIIFAKGSTGKYNIPVRSMITSCGEPTPTGDFYTPGKYRWLEMAGGSWAQWCTQIMGDYLFHSVPNDLRNNYTMWSGEFNNLGTTRSLGCIRLTCEDAKWVFDNCALGTHVNISRTETSGPLKKPAGIKIPSWHTWDPTDPTAKYLCKQHGCH